MSDPILVDARGRPLQQTAGRELYKSINSSNYRRNVPRMNKDYSEMLSDRSLSGAISDVRHALTKHSPLRGAIKQKSTFVNACGWIPEYLGRNKEWGDRAKAWLMDHFKVCNIRGRNFSFKKSKRIECAYYDSDGSHFKVWVNDPYTGEPKTQIIEAHRVMNLPGQTEVEGSSHPNARVFDGASIVNGVIFGDYGEELGIQILSRGRVPEVVAVVPVGSYQHCCNPEYFSESRTIPPIAYVVWEFLDQWELRRSLMHKAKMGAKLVMTADTGSGRLFGMGGAGGALQPVAQGPAGKVEMQELNDGEVLTFVAGKGEGIRPFVMDVPGNNTLDFDALIERGGFYAIGWRREMLDLKGLNSPAVHAFADMINHSIRDRWELQRDYGVEEVQWYLAGGIENGELEEDPDWMLWDFRAPAEFTTNPSKTKSADHEALRYGTTTHVKIAAKNNQDWEENLWEEGRWLDVKKKVAKHYGHHPDELGRSDKPGDAPSTAPDTNTEEDETETEEEENES